MATRLPGVDAGFLYMETPTLHMHTLKIALLDVASVEGGLGVERLQRELADRLHLLPPFSKRVVQVPLQLHHPVWVETGPVDDAYHVRRVAVPAPGGMRDLEQVIGEIAGTPLDRLRPLWEMYVCEGLADGRLAVVTKMHHALADGMAANHLLANVMDGGVPTAAQPTVAEPEPTRGKLLVDAFVAWWAQLFTVPALLVHTAQRLAAVAAHARTALVRTPRPVLDTPKVSFNGAITARRSFATASLSMLDAKAVRRRYGVTLNDVVLAVVAGALRRWLDEHGEAPSGPLVAGVPVGTDARDAGVRLSGNRVSNLFVTLATDVDDPVERLQRIAEVARGAKALQGALGLDMLERWVQFAPPGPFSLFMRGYSRLRAADRHRAPFNLVVSNVPGPQAELSVGGARLDELYSVGPVLEGIGLNVTVWSYLDRLAFSVLGCPDTMPDLPSLAAHLPAALDELLAARDENAFL